MFAQKYTKEHYYEAYLIGRKLQPFYPSQEWPRKRPDWLWRVGVTKYGYTIEDLWMAYWCGFHKQPRPKEKRR